MLYPKLWIICHLCFRFYFQPCPKSVFERLNGGRGIAGSNEEGTRLGRVVVTCNLAYKKVQGNFRVQPRCPSSCLLLASSDGLHFLAWSTPTNGLQEVCSHVPHMPRIRHVDALRRLGRWEFPTGEGASERGREPASQPASQRASQKDHRVSQREEETHTHTHTHTERERNTMRETPRQRPSHMEGRETG